MRVFTCLSQNVSMVMEKHKKRSSSSSSSSSTFRRPHLNFKSKKKRPLTPVKSMTTQKVPSDLLTAGRVVTPRSAAFGKFADENAPPSTMKISINSNSSSSSSSNNTYDSKPPSRVNKPLPPIPDENQGGVSIYVKEVGDEDYLPLSHVASPLKEEDEPEEAEGNYYVNISDSRYPSSHAVVAVDQPPKLPPPRNTFVRSSKTSVASSVFSDLDGKLTSVKSLNEAFLQSAASLQAKQVLSLDLDTKSVPHGSSLNKDRQPPAGTYSRQRQLGNRDWKRGRVARISESPESNRYSRYGVDHYDQQKSSETTPPPPPPPCKADYVRHYVTSPSFNTQSRRLQQKQQQQKQQQQNFLHACDSQVDVTSVSSPDTQIESPVYSQLDATSLTLSSGRRRSQRIRNRDSASPVYSQVDNESSQAERGSSILTWTIEEEDFIAGGCGGSAGVYENTDRMGRPRGDGESQTSIIDVDFEDDLDPDHDMSSQNWQSMETEDEESQVSDYSQVDYTPSPPPTPPPPSSSSSSSSPISSRFHPPRPLYLPETKGAQNTKKKTTYPGSHFPSEVADIPYCYSRKTSVETIESTRSGSRSRSSGISSRGSGSTGQCVDNQNNSEQLMECDDNDSYERPVIFHHHHHPDGGSCPSSSSPAPPPLPPHEPNHYVNTMPVPSKGHNSYQNKNNNDIVDSTEGRESEFLGCMSFGVPNLTKKVLDGWWCLLAEDIGRRKHMLADPRDVAGRGLSAIPAPLAHRSTEGQGRIVINVQKGKSGFGFSFVEELPPRIGRVDRASPAELAGVKKGDAVIRINGQNVSRSTSESVANLVKKTNTQILTLELMRDHISKEEIAATPNPQPTGSTTRRGVGTSTDHVYESILDGTPRVEHHKENHNRRGGDAYASRRRQEQDFLPEDETIISHGGLGNRGNIHPAVSSTPMPSKGVSKQTANSHIKKQECIHRLMSLELDYIDFMRLGTERFSRPLRHCVISPAQHSVIFQNVEKLVIISQYHIKQLQDGFSDTDDSQCSETNENVDNNEAHAFPNSAALTYHSKIDMLCQAYETYVHGLTNSNAMLKELSKNRDFMSFIINASQEAGNTHPSISAFINRPVQHIHELYGVLRDMFQATPHASADHAQLQRVVCRLAQCISNITNLSTDGRVHSFDSLVSSNSHSQTTSSGKGSMASLNSVSSAETEALSSFPPTTSSSNRSVDAEVAKIQELLVFPPDVPTFQLCQEDRHIIFQGDIFRFHQEGAWFKSRLLLLSDLMLILDPEPNGKLKVVDSPIFLSDLAGIEVNRKHASEFIFHLHSTPIYMSLPRGHGSRTKGQASSNRPQFKPLVLRAPSSQEKFVWRSLVEQRVASVSGSRLQHYGSMRDISNIKTSAVL